jgi:hypothetical protein
LKKKEKNLWLGNTTFLPYQKRSLELKFYLFASKAARMASKAARMASKAALPVLLRKQGQE